VDLPDSPAGRRLREFLEGVRDGDLDEAAVRERMADVFLDAIGGPCQVLEIARPLRPMVAALTLDWIDGSSSDLMLAVELSAADGSGLAVSAVVEPGEPHRLTGMQFRPFSGDRPTLGPVAELPAREVRSRADDGFDDEVAAALVGALEAFVATGQVGVAAAAVVDGRCWTAEAGLASVEAARRVEPDTIFRAYSISKTVTAQAVLSLVADGKLALDDPVDEHLTAFRLVPFEGSPQPTVRQLLTHTGGVSSQFEHWVEQVKPVAAQLGAEWPCEWAPGSSWAYSNGGYATLGQLVEDVSGQPFEDFVADRVLRPLGMEDSEYRSTNGLGERWAVGYDVRRGQVAPADATVPSVLGAGSLFTTALDLARFGAAVSSGEDEVGQFASQLDESLGHRQGLAWMLGDVDERTWASHGGGGHGFATMLSVLPGSGAAIVVLTNIGGNPLNDVAGALQRVVGSHVG
jgi:CubicO group peptidase (beta-lactamase class C family)